MGSKHAWIGTPVVTEEVRIVPQDIYRRKNRLYVRVTMWNLGKSPVVVDRDQVQVQLVGGRVLERSGRSRKVYTVQPGSAQSLYVDFKDDALDGGGAAQVFWTGAVFDGGRQLLIPATDVREELD